MPKTLLEALGEPAGVEDIDVEFLPVPGMPRPRYTLDELLAEAEASGAYPLPPEEREWVDAPAVGLEKDE